jgi:hypothetical protein
MNFFKKDTVFILACHIRDFEQIDLLHNLCSWIKRSGYDYILSSHTKVPDHIVSESRAFLYDPNNKLVPVENRDLSQRGVFYIKTNEFIIESPFFMHGGDPCYAQAHVDNVYNGLITALKFGYSFAHFLTYDSKFEILDIQERERKLKHNFIDFVGYARDGRILGDSWSINLNKINVHELLTKDIEIAERISKLQHDDSVYLQSYLLSNLRKDLIHYEHDDYRIGSYVNPKKSKKTEWALFYDKGVNIFIQNISREDIKIYITTLSGTSENIVHVGTYCYFRIYEENTFGILIMKLGEDILCTIDLSDENERKFWVETTSFIKI